MQLVSIPLARALAFVELAELNLGGRIFLPTLATALAERYRFTKSPSTPKDFDLGEGVTFEGGVIDGRLISKLAVFPALIYLDGANSTEESKSLLLGILEWARDQFGLNYTETSIRRWAFVSNVVINTDFPLLEGMNPVLNEVSKEISRIVHGNLKEELKFVPAKISLAHDPQTRASTLAPFTIEHRGMTLFEENIYYCEAPIPTSDHLRALEAIAESFKENYENRQ